METLLELLDCYPKNLVNHIRSSLRPKGNATPGKSKIYSLLTTLLNSRKTDDEYYIRKIYGTNASAEFRTLKHRLKKKLIECLVNEDISNLSPEFEKIDKDMLECTKQLYAARIILRLKGNSTTALNLLASIENKVKENEHYALLLECLNLKKYNSAFINPIKDFDKINSDIEKYHTTYKLVNKANDYYYQYIVHPQMKSNEQSNSNFENELRNAIFELKQDIEHTNSNLTKYFRMNLEMEYCSRINDYGTGLSLCDDLITLIEKAPSVYRKQRMANALINYSFFSAKLNRVPKAIEYACKAIEYSIEGSINYLLYNDILIPLLILNNDLDIAEDKIAECQMITQKLKNRYFEAKFNFLYAILLFKKKEYTRSLSILSTKTIIDQDKAGLSQFVKLYKVLLNITLENYDSADNELDSITRQYYELPISLKENKRFAQLLESLVLWRKLGFKSLSCNSSHELPLIKCLQHLKSKYSWEPLTPEVISISEELEKYILVNQSS